MEEESLHNYSLTLLYMINPFSPKSDQFQISPCSLTRNITSHSVNNLAFHSLLRWKRKTLYSWTRLSRTPRYLEQNRISLGFALVFAVIYYGLSRTRLSRPPRYLELFLAPLSSNQPLSNCVTLGRNSGQNQSGSAVKAPRGKMYWKLRNVLTCSR